MWDTRNIRAVRIAKRRADLAAELDELGMGERTVIGVLETGEEVDLFAYDDDQLNFDPRELVGLTVSIARRLRRERELAYLQS